MEGDGGRWRAKLYKLLPDGGWDAQGVGLVQLAEEDGVMSLVMHEEDDEDRLIIRTRIAAENSYTEQENTIITWTESSTGTELALSFQGHEGKDHVWASLQAYKQRLLMDSEDRSAVSSNAPSAGNSSSASSSGTSADNSGGTHDTTANGSSGESTSASNNVAYGRRAGSFLEPASDSDCDDDDFRMYGASDFGAPKDLPKPESGLDNLQHLLKVVEEAVSSIMEREPLTHSVTQDNNAWLLQLGKVFAAAEQNSQHAQCEVVHNVMRQLALASTRQLLSTLTSDSFWPLLVAAFEYDHTSAAAASSVARTGTPALGDAGDVSERSGTPMPHQQSDSGSLPGTPVVPVAAPPAGSQATAPTSMALPATAASGAATSSAQTSSAHSGGASPTAGVRPHHRRFLRNIKFRTAVPLEDEDMVQTIHQTFRLQFLRDVLLPCALDHSFVSTVTSMISENHMMLVAHFAQDEQYVARLLTVLHDNKQRHKRRHSILTKAVHRSRRHSSRQHTPKPKQHKERHIAAEAKPLSPGAGPLPALSNSGASAVTPEPSSSAASAAAATPSSEQSAQSADSAITHSPSGHDRISARAQAAAVESPTYPVQAQTQATPATGMLPANASITPALIASAGGAAAAATTTTTATAPSVEVPQRPAALGAAADDTTAAAAPTAAPAADSAAAPATDAAAPADEPNTQPSSDTVPLAAAESTEAAAGEDTAAPVADPLQDVQLPPLSSVQAPAPPASYDARDAMKFLKEISQAALKHATMGDRRDLFARLLQPVEREGRELFLLDVFAPVLADRTAGVEEVQTALDVLIAIVDAEPDTVRGYMLRQHESLQHVPPKLDDASAGDGGAGGIMSAIPRLSSSQLREVRQGEHGHLLPLLDDDLASSKVQRDAEGQPPAGCCYSNASLLYCLVWRLLEDPDVGVQGLAGDAVKSLWDPDRLPSGELHDFLSMFYDHYMPLLLRPLTHPQLAPIPTVPQSSHLLSLMRRTGASSAGQAAGQPLRRPRPTRPIVVDATTPAAPQAAPGSDSGPIRVSSNAATVGAPEEDGGVTGGVKRARSFESEGVPDLGGGGSPPASAGETSSPQKRARHGDAAAADGSSAAKAETTPVISAAGKPVQVQLQPLSPEPTTAGSTVTADKPAGAAAAGASSTVAATEPRSAGLTLAEMQQAAGRLGQESSCSKHSKLLLCGLLAFALEHHTHRIKYFLVRQNVAVQVMRLVYYPERHMQLAGIRFLRAVMGGNDAFYHRYMARLSLFGHVFWALAANGSMANLVNSAVLESLHYVAQENIEILIKDLTNKYGTVLREISYSRAPAAILRKARQLARGQQLTATATASLGDYGMDSDNDSEEVQPKQGTAAAMRASRGTALSGSGDGLSGGGGGALFGRRSLLSRSALNRPALGAGRPRFGDEDEDGDSDLTGDGSDVARDQDGSDGDNTPVLEDGADLMADLENASPAAAEGNTPNSAPAVPDAEMAEMLSAALRRDKDDDDDEDDETPFGLSKLAKPKAALAAVPKSAPSALSSQSIFSHVSAAASDSSASSTVSASSPSVFSSAVTSGIMSGPQIAISLDGPSGNAAAAGSNAQPLVDYGPEAE